MTDVCDSSFGAFFFGALRGRRSMRSKLEEAVSSLNTASARGGQEGKNLCKAEEGAGGEKTSGA